MPEAASSTDFYFHAVIHRTITLRLIARLWQTTATATAVITAAASLDLHHVVVHHVIVQWC